MAKNKDNKFESVSFLMPWKLIKTKHFSKKDIRNIKDSLISSFSLVYLIASIGLALIISALSIYMNIRAKNMGTNIIDYYGLVGFIGQITIISLCTVAALMIIFAKFTHSKSVSIALIRIGGDILFVAVTSYFLCCIFTDAEKGFTTKSETLSAGIIFIAILALIQPVFWIDAAILDLGVSFGLLGVTIFCYNMFNMGAIEYYGIVVLLFPFVSYLVVSLLFYAESQKYKEILENEKLHNRAYYDKLTLCKNRYALSEFLKENKNRWENKDNANLLMIIFDIDDFKLYNDQFSHLGGDYCLKSICDAVRQEFPSPSLDFFRYGGEEFLLFFEVNDESEGAITLERVRTAISKLEITAPNGAPKKMVTISLGGLFCKNIKAFEFDEKMKTVDAYLYQAKRSGKDVSCYNGTIIN